ncbi:MAG: hypothetical protein AAF213_01835 [Pseudomonadota bacterium]
MAASQDLISPQDRWEAMHNPGDSQARRLLFLETLFRRDRQDRHFGPAPLTQSQRRFLAQSGQARVTTMTEALTVLNTDASAQPTYERVVVKGELPSVWPFQAMAVKSGTPLPTSVQHQLDQGHSLQDLAMIAKYGDAAGAYAMPRLGLFGEQEPTPQPAWQKQMAAITALEALNRWSLEIMATPQFAIDVRDARGQAKLAQRGRNRVQETAMDYQLQGARIARQLSRIYKHWDQAQAQLTTRLSEGPAHEVIATIKKDPSLLGALQGHNLLVSHTPARREALRQLKDPDLWSAMASFGALQNRVAFQDQATGDAGKTSAAARGDHTTLPFQVAAVRLGWVLNEPDKLGKVRGHVNDLALFHGTIHHQPVTALEIARHKYDQADTDFARQAWADQAMAAYTAVQTDPMARQNAAQQNMDLRGPIPGKTVTARPAPPPKPGPGSHFFPRIG